MKVLLVDDDKAIRSLLRIAFSVEDGVGEVREAVDGIDALALCETFEPDLVFLDYWMPSLDGASTARSIRTRYPHARIIAFSGVLDEKPEWADDLYIKGDLPDLELVIDLTRS
ncbi:MAG: response regulator transcription factor [Actinomycetota bacterium]